MTLKVWVHLQLEISVGKNLSSDILSLESTFNEKDSFGKYKINGENLGTLSRYFLRKPFELPIEKRTPANEFLSGVYFKYS